MRQLALVSFTLAACFNAGDPPLRCSAEQPGCPSGLVCVADACVGPVAGDLGQAVDMGPDDMSRPPSLCADGQGSPIGTMGAWACPGIFTAGKAANQCKNQKICADSNLIAESACLSIAGFFISQVWGATNRYYQTPSVSECKTAAFPNSFGYFGCGKGGGVVNNACFGFRAIIICDPVNMFICPTVDLTTAANTNPQNGVLCCP